MDPLGLGLGLENYDAIGAYRTEDQGLPIDASGQLFEGPSFADAREMAGLVQSDERFNTCVVEQLFTYALGRPPADDEHAFLESIAASFNANGADLRELIKLLATSETFRTRRGTMEGNQ